MISDPDAMAYEAYVRGEGGGKGTNKKNSNLFSNFHFFFSFFLISDLDSSLTAFPRIDATHAQNFCRQFLLPSAIDTCHWYSKLNTSNRFHAPSNQCQFSYEDKPTKSTSDFLKRFCQPLNFNISNVPYFSSLPHSIPSPFSSTVISSRSFFYNHLFNYSCTFV